MNNKVKDIVLTIIFITFLFAFMIVNIVKKDDDISYSERRKLQKMPKITYDSVINGTYFNTLDKYTTDQFILRDNFRKIKIDIDLLTKNNYNKLYLYEDYIIEETYPLNKESILNVTNKINNIKRTYLNDTNNVYYSIVPDKNYFANGDNLKLDYNELKNIMNSNLDIKYIDIFNELSLEDYYKTDTHWKEEKLSKVVNKLSKEMNFNINNNYNFKRISDFNGTYSSRIVRKDIKDEIYILDNDNDMNVYNYETNGYEKIYDLTKLNSFDKYNVYLNGSVSLLKIESMNTSSNKELIVFRDSYGSSLIPLMVDGYKSITVVDTRYISSSMLSNYIDFNNKDILFLYSTLLINDSFTLK